MLFRAKEIVRNLSVYSKMAIQKWRHTFRARQNQLVRTLGMISITHKIEPPINNITYHRKKAVEEDGTMAVMLGGEAACDQAISNSNNSDRFATIIKKF